MENAIKKGNTYEIPNFKAIILDKETYFDNNIHKLLAICFYDDINT